MIEQLPIIDLPDWLLRVDPATIEQEVFPLADILQGSLYYPASGFDGDPVAYLAGNILSFVHVDYSHTEKELNATLANSGFCGYRIVARRNLTKKELTPHGWTPVFPSPEDGDPSRCRDWMTEPFCVWAIFEREQEMPATHGPQRFSLLHLCADGVAAFQALYVANEQSPSIVAIIQPGHGFGQNWTDFTDPNLIFARSVLGNPAGRPEHLLYGGAGGPDMYRTPCWPVYRERVCFLGNTSIGVWRHAEQTGQRKSAAS